MLKRNGKVAYADQDQLNLFDFARFHEPANLPDPIRIDGGTPLAGVSADNGLRDLSEAAMREVLLHSKFMALGRKQRGLSQETLASRARLSRAGIGHMESGRTTPTLLLLLKIASVLEVDLFKLFRKAEQRVVT